MREAAGLRDEVENILKFSHGANVLSASEVMTYTGRSRGWMRAHIGNCTNGISAVQLARALLKLNNGG